MGTSLAVGGSPLLGLDLQGGLSVIYAPDEPADDDQLILVQDLMRDQLESFGIAEPDVRVEGQNIIADLPGVTDQEKAFAALNVSGIVSLRPVLACAPIATPDVTGSTVPASTTPTATSAPATTVVDEDDEQSFPSLHSADDSARVARRLASPPVTTDEGEVVLSLPGNTDGSIVDDSVPVDSIDLDTVPETTAPAADSTPTSQPSVPAELPEGYNQLPYPGAGLECVVGPSGGSGEVFERKSAVAGIDQFTGGWVVTVNLRSDGEVLWNELAAECYAGSSACPTRQLAIVLDDVIQSAPTVQARTFSGSVQISGSFTEEEVSQLASVLNRGAFPVQVHQERVETVSPTAGQGSLKAAIIAGLIGVALMLAFMIWYYRRLSVVIVSGLLVWGSLVFALATWVSRSTNYALTLAGATGIIVAVGVTVDTYVVFFERLREEMRHGRVMANAAPRSFASSWRTILSADLVSLMASLILFWLSVGSVKGFALYLGLTTVCDLVVFYFYTRPAVYLLASKGWLDRQATDDKIGALA
ncbi:MAG: protein translocase subunit SecD [Ilumatobacter coccineus]|uniref:Protein translocase subunit SecD n=1 Tax=Ilumatobacter coccineus TaxID=467094 RepID=A0A2G6K9Z6_9ACTN|nr:MAG: protein translocase subunit SecD [Ilumatobacter coccineus]